MSKSKGMENEDESTVTDSTFPKEVTASEKQLENLLPTRDHSLNTGVGITFLGSTPELLVATQGPVPTKKPSVAFTMVDSSSSIQTTVVSLLKPTTLIGPRRTKSMYDHVENDFVKTGKKTFLFRLVVVGTHDEDPTEFMRTKRNMIEDINAVCHDEAATGFFLAYPRQFIHVLEGSEDTLNNYLERCAETYELNLSPHPTSPGGRRHSQNSGLGGGHAKDTPPTHQDKESTTQSESTQFPQGNPYKRPPKIRMLVLGYFSIADRFLPRWLSTKFNPPRQTGKIQGGFRKNLFELVRTSLILAIIMSKQPTNKNGEIDWPDQNDSQNRERKGQDMQLMQYLPSQHLIMYVMKDKERRIKLKTPSEFIKQYWGVPDLILTNEIDWPIPCRIAPYH